MGNCYTRRSVRKDSDPDKKLTKSKGQNPLVYVPYDEASKEGAPVQVFTKEGETDKEAERAPSLIVTIKGWSH